jgi:hypothetical protein
MNSRTDRLARGTVAAGIATFVAALSHDVGGGAFPSPVLLAVAFVVSVGWCTAVVGRRFSWLRVSAAVAASQALFHGTFGLASSHDAHIVVESSGASSAHAGHAGMTTLTVIDDATTHAHDGAPMLLAHIGAAIVTILALRLGDRSSLGIAALTRLVAAVVRTATVVALPVPRHPARIRPDGSGFRPSRVASLLGGLRHRGPPSVVAAA